MQRKFSENRPYNAFFFFNSICEVIYEIFHISQQHLCAFTFVSSFHLPGGNQARTPLVHCARPLPHPNLDTTLTQYLEN